MPTFVAGGCEHFHWLTETSYNATAQGLILGAGFAQQENGGPFYSAAGPYTGDRCVLAGSDSAISRSLGGAIAEVHFHLYYKFTITFGGAYFFGLFDGSTQQLSIGRSSNGDLYLYRGATIIATAYGVLSAGIWNYIQFRAVIDPSSGVGIVRVNNVEKINFSGNTRNTANNQVTDWRIHTVYTSDAFAHIVSYSDSGSWPLNECRYMVGDPDAAGNSAQFTPLSSTNVSNVDEQQPDGDTTYNSSTTPGNKDTFGTDMNVPSGKTVHLTMEDAWAKKTDAGARDLRTVVRSGGTDYESSSFALSSGYILYRNIRTVDPNTSSAWTPSGVNAAEVGYKDQA